MGISATGEKLLDFEVKFGGCYSLMDGFIIWEYCVFVRFRDDLIASVPEAAIVDVIPSSTILTDIESNQKNV